MCDDLCFVYVIIGKNVTIKLAMVLGSVFSFLPCITNWWDVRALDGLFTHRTRNKDGRFCTLLSILYSLAFIRF